MTTTEILAVTAAATTFVGFVAADQQQERVKHGTFGAFAGTSLGAVGAITTKDANMLTWAAFGASLGAVLGWFVHLALCLLAASSGGRRILEYVSGGLKSVQARLDLDEQHLLLRSLESWMRSFGSQITIQAYTIVTSMPKSSDADKIRAQIMRGWIASMVDAFNVIFSQSQKQLQYRIRASLIVFYETASGAAEGKHWISYSGGLHDHRDKPFTQQSIAYMVLKGELPSPTYRSHAHANESWQNRGENRYSSFFTFRVTPNVVLTVDWPDKVKETDTFVMCARNFVHGYLEYGLQQVLQGWSCSVAEEVSPSIVPNADDRSRDSPRMSVSGTADGKPVGVAG